MARRPVIGITCSTADTPPGKPARSYLNRAYTRAVAAAGAIPLVITPTGNTEGDLAYLDAIDGLLLSGGDDVVPARYGEEAEDVPLEFDVERDALELPLVRAALARDMPVFGICRGVQVVNVALGGTLYQHLPVDRPSCVEHNQAEAGYGRGDLTHAVAPCGATRLTRLASGSEFRSNSLHHQGIKAVAPGLVVSGEAEDGMVEVLEGPDCRYLLAVQFHPEETREHEEVSARLFDEFVAEAALG